MSAGTGDTTSSFLTVVEELMVFNWDSVLGETEIQNLETNYV